MHDEAFAEQLGGLRRSKWVGLKKHLHNKIACGTRHTVGNLSFIPAAEMSDEGSYENDMKTRRCL